MSNVKSFNNFNTSYKELERNFLACKRFLLECYHHDANSEPTISILSGTEDLTFDDIDGEKHITIRFIGGTDVCFRESIHLTNLSNGDVVFSSKHDDETYYLISFHKGVI